MNKKIHDSIPKVQLRILSWFCPDHLYEEIEGDLIQRFEKDVKALGERKAKRKLLWNTIRFFRPGILLRNKFSIRIIDTTMLRNYFTVAWRSFLKRKTLSAINVIGISLGVTFSLLALLFVFDEFSFDSFHQNKNFIYRVDRYAIDNGNPYDVRRASGFPIPFGPALKESISGIDYFSRYDDRTNYIKTDKKQFRETIHYVDRDFPKMFTFDFIEGNSETALQNENDILISHSKAYKLFGNTEVSGKVVEIEDRSYTITGVFKSFSRNTSLDCEILILYQNFPPYKNQHEDWNAFYSPVFVQLNPLKKTISLNSQLEKFSIKYFSKGNSKDQRIGLVLTSLKDIHFDNQVSWFKVSNIKYSYILGGIALIVLLVACINYVLLSLAGSLSRTREIGIRKVIGATSKMIRTQFLGESLILIGMSLSISLLIIQWVLPIFNNFMNKEINLLDLSIGHWSFFLFGVITLTGLLAGGYPALVLSNLMPEKILKGKSSRNHKNKFSEFLIGFQFTTCFVLLTCAFVMHKQMLLVQAKDLGFNKEQVMIVNATNDLNINVKVILNNFRTELANEKDIIKISGMGFDFGFISGSSFRMDSTGHEISEYYTGVDYDFFELLDIELIEGRFFSREFPADTINRYVVNEALANQLGNKTVIGGHLSTNSDSEIIGIVKDFNFQSLEYKVEPMAFTLGKSFKRIFIKIQPDNIPTTVAKLEATWKKIVGDGHLQFTFLDDYINKQYERYTQWTKIISISTFLAIIIAVMGLLGMINLAVINRTKEISIRRVFGATISSILFLFSNRYAKLIFYGFFVSVPVANYFLEIWLQSFAYKLEMAWWLYALPFMLILCLAMIITGSQIIKAVKANPVESIRYE
jgi:putative ABC transport system permease protein